MWKPDTGARFRMTNPGQMTRMGTRQKTETRFSHVPDVPSACLLYTESRIHKLGSGSHAAGFLHEGNRPAFSSVFRREAMPALIWVLAIGWLAAALANFRRIRSIERDWEQFLREHDALPRERQHLSPATIVEFRR